MCKKTEDELMNTTFIKDYIKSYNENDTEDNAIMFYGQLMIRICEGGKAPMPLVHVTNIAFCLDPDVEAEDMFSDTPESERYLKIKGVNGKFWLPLFTDRSEMKGLAKYHEVKEIPIKDIVELAHSLPGLNGVLINPYTDGFTLCQEQLANILETLPQFKEAIDNVEGFRIDEDEGEA